MKRVLIGILILFSLAVLLLFFSGIFFNQESTPETDLTDPQELQIDESVLNSTQPNPNISGLERDELPLALIIEPQEPEEDLVVQPSAILSGSEIAERKDELNSLGEVLGAVQSLSLVHETSLTGLFKSGEYEQSDIQEYQQLLSFSAQYISSLQPSYYAIEHSTLGTSLNEMAGSLGEILQAETDTAQEHILDFSTHSTKVNQTMLQISQDVRAKAIPFSETEPGYIFIFTL